MEERRAVMIMAGGRGTRLWPLSRRDRPKQFISLVTDRTLIEDTYARVAPLAPPGRVFVVAEEGLLARARELLTDIPKENFLAEPAARNTWPCCVWGTAAVADRLGEEVVVLAVPADHAVADATAFRAAVAAGMGRAAAGAIVVFGIKPDRAETGYGYMRCAEALAAGPPRVRRGLAFAEKPDAATAAAYIASGEYLWNSGMFAWRADRFHELCGEHCADAYDVACELKRTFAPGAPAPQTAALYEQLEATSVDYAFMEKLGAFEVVETACGWDDIGSFEALERVVAADAAGNVTHGDVYTIVARGNVALSGARPVVLLAAEGLVVADAGDVVLVYPKGRGQEVRRAVELMKKERPDLV